MNNLWGEVSLSQLGTMGVTRVRATGALVTTQSRLETILTGK